MQRVFIGSFRDGRDGRDDCDGILCTVMIVAAVVASGIWIIDKLGSTVFLVRPAFSGIIASEIQPGYSMGVLISYGLSPVSGAS